MTPVFIVICENSRLDRFIVAKKEVDRSFNIAEIRFPSGGTDVAIKCNSNRCNCNIVGCELLLLLLLLAVVFLRLSRCGSVPVFRFYVIDP